MRPIRTPKITPKLLSQGWFHQFFKEMPDSGQFFEFAMAYLLRRPWASEAIEAASHKVVAATAL